jgi:hypothetical protein
MINRSVPRLARCLTDGRRRSRTRVMPADQFGNFRLLPKEALRRQWTQVCVCELVINYWQRRCRHCVSSVVCESMCKAACIQAECATPFPTFIDPVERSVAVNYFKGPNHQRCRRHGPNALEISSAPKRSGGSKERESTRWTPQCDQCESSLGYILTCKRSGETH